MSAYKIEKGVPIPVAGNAQGITETIRKLDVGDSVLFAGKNINNVATISSQIRQKDPDKRFTCRTQGDGTRIWRTE